MKTKRRVSQIFRQSQITQSINRFTTLILLLLFNWFGFGQDDSRTFVQTRFRLYGQQALKEKIFAQTDKAFFPPGEFILFKRYDMDRGLKISLERSKLANDKVINTDKKRMLRAKFLLSMEAAPAWCLNGLKPRLKFHLCWFNKMNT